MIINHCFIWLVRFSLSTAIQKIKAAGKAAGTLALNPQTALSYERLGVQFIALGVDTLALATTASSILSQHKQSL